MVEDSVTLVRVRRPAARKAPPADLPFEPAFYDAGGALLPQLPNPAWRERYTEHLGYHVASQNRDLLAHVRRILLYAAAGKRQATYLAIADLFQVLGTKGLDLRRDMLNRVQAVLTPMQVSNLNAQLAQQQTLTTMLDLPTSRFTRKTTAKLVTRRETPAASRGTDGDPLDEARELLNSGQFELAQKVLEAALPKHPGNVAMHEELMEIYRRAGDLASAEAMRAKLKGVDRRIEQQWVDTITMLRTGELELRPPQPPRKL
jgi:hypothetical protein